MWRGNFIVLNGADPLPPRADETPEPQPSQAQGKGPSWRRRFLLFGATLAGGLAGLTALLWHQAQGLEQRVLAEIQPHLLTDVSVASIGLTVWSSWPDVEVELRDVVVEDAVDRGQPFLNLSSLGIAFAWRPLLQGRFEVSNVVLRSGTVSIHRNRKGQENWRFWKATDGDAAPAFTLQSVAMEDVALSGTWWADAAKAPIVWAAHCRSGAWVLNGGSGGNEKWQGPVHLESASLKATDVEWLSGVELMGDVSVIGVEGDLEIGVSDGRIRRGNHRCGFEAGLSSLGGDFAMSLRLPQSEVEALRALLPRDWQNMEALSALSAGTVDLDVQVGERVADGLWSGPGQSGWDGAWALRVVPEGLQGKVSTGLVEVRTGRAEAFSSAGGWQAHWADVTGSAAEGEFRSAGYWASSKDRVRLSLQGEAVARPEAVLAMVPQDWMPLPLRLAPGGVVRAQGEAVLERGKGLDWRWTEGEVVFSGESWAFAVADAAGTEWLAGAVQGVEATGTPSGWTARVVGLGMPGLTGSVAVTGFQGVVPWQVKAELHRVEPDLLLEAMLGVESMTMEGGEVAAVPGLDFAVSIDELEYGALRAAAVEFEGSLDRNGRYGRLESIAAQAFGGRVSAEGHWNPDRLSFEGRLAEADIPAFLEGTEGLGQEVLLPEHVRGTVWAVGGLEYVWNRRGPAAWETELDVRMEGAELIDFPLLQEIPEVLRGSPKYRLLADVDDLERRLRRVRIEPLDARVTLDRGVISLDAVEVESDAMNVGVEGWQSLDGAVSYTLDFALRDLKSSSGEFGTQVDDGLGHRFFLAVGGTLDALEFGYDRAAHKQHRQEERQASFGRLRELLLGSDAGREVAGEDSVQINAQSEGVQEPGLRPGRPVKQPVDLDDDDDFSP